MVGSTGDSGVAPERNKPWSAAVLGSGNGPETVKRDGVRVGRPGCGWESDHEEVKTQEGKVGRQYINRVLVMRTDSRVARGPEGDQRLLTRAS
jgi:hypothetical protein